MPTRLRRHACHGMSRFGEGRDNGPGLKMRRAAEACSCVYGGRYGPWPALPPKGPSSERAGIKAASCLVRETLVIDDCSTVASLPFQLRTLQSQRIATMSDATEEPQSIRLLKKVPIFETWPHDGDGKSQNTTPYQKERPDIKNWKNSKFHIDVEMVTCVHGTWSEIDPTKASFIVFQCEFMGREDHIVEEVNVQWEFVNDSSALGPPSNPSVAARGPHISRIYNPDEVNTTDNFGANAAVSGTAGPVTPSAGINASRTNQFKRDYFGEVKSGKEHVSNTDHRFATVWWDYKQNKHKKDGVSPGFRIAVLLKRDNDSPFKGLFSITRFNGGWKYRVEEAWNKYWGRTVPDIVDPVNFDPDPTRPPLGGKGVVKNKLGELASEEGIGPKWAWIWGLDVGK
jgi:hypothetical protein